MAPKQGSSKLDPYISNPLFLWVRGLIRAAQVVLQPVLKIKNSSDQQRLLALPKVEIASDW